MKRQPNPPPRRSTRQRKQVLDAVCGANHPTAQEVYEGISGTPVSLSTVYRNLAILEQEGEIASVECPSSSFRYDRRRDPHYHLYCRSCGKVFDLPLPYAPGLDADAEQQSGCRVFGHRIVFEGLCKDCEDG